MSLGILDRPNADRFYFNIDGNVEETVNLLILSRNNVLGLRLGAVLL